MQFEIIIIPTRQRFNFFQETEQSVYTFETPRLELAAPLSDDVTLHYPEDEASTDRREKSRPHLNKSWVGDDVLPAGGLDLHAAHHAPEARHSDDRPKSCSHLILNHHR